MLAAFVMENKSRVGMKRNLLLMHYFSFLACFYCIALEKDTGNEAVILSTAV